MTAKDFPTVPATVEAIKAEITELITDGTVPATVKSFSELHDYVDANMLAEDIFPAQPDFDDDDAVQDWFDKAIEILNPAQDVVSAWLEAGRPE
jgi:hypothetical protein